MSNVYGFDFLKSDHQAHESSITTRITEPSSSSSPSTLPQHQHQHQHQKSDLEKQHDVLKFLKNHRSSGCLPPPIIYNHISVDLSEGGNDKEVRQWLLKHPLIKVEEEPDPENPSLTIFKFGYQAKYNNVRNKVGLLAQINKSKYGIKRMDLLDSYEGVDGDISELITAGEIIGIPNSEEKMNYILFPRGEGFYVELDGNVAVVGNGAGDNDNDDGKVLKEQSTAGTTKEESLSNDEKGAKNAAVDADTDSGAKAETGTETSATAVSATTTTATTTTTTTATTTTTTDKTENTNKNNSNNPPPQPPKVNPYLIKTDANPKKQIRRGEAIWIGGQWFRVSSAIKDLPLSDQPPRAQAPLTVSSYKNLSQKNDAEGYIRPFNSTIIPLDHELSLDSLNNIQKGKEALMKLHQITSTEGGGGGGGGRGSTGGGAVSAQLLSSNATSDNFESLVEKYAFTSGGHGLSSAARRRPTSSIVGRSHLFHSQHGYSTKHKKGHGTTSSTSHHIEQATEAAKNPHLIYNHPRRHGCTLDVRELYLGTKNEIPPPEKEIDIFNMMIECGLLDKNSKMKRPRMSEENKNLDKDGKPMKRRYYIKKSDQLRNDHLKDTVIGDILQAALDKQSQGKAVGDGGM